jgi:hypothetical protein
MLRSTLEAKVEKLAEIVADASDGKESHTVGDTREAQAQAARDVLDADTQYEVQDVELPTERLGSDDDEDDG